MQISLFLSLPDGLAPRPPLQALPALAKLLSRADRQDLPGAHREAALCGLFDVSLAADAPSAALTAGADGIEVSDDYWLRADPVHLQAQRDDAVPFEVTDLETHDARALLESLNEFLAADAIQLIWGATNRWYLRLRHAPCLATSPLSRAVGQPMGLHLPTGRDAPKWASRLTEIQMLLHTHAVNEARETSRKVPINGLWVWGGGVLPTMPPSAFHTVYGDDVLAYGLAHCADVRSQTAPTGFDKLPRHEHALVVLDSEHDTKRWEQDWFAPMLSALNRRALDQCDIVIWSDRAQRYRLRPNYLWRFWRRPTHLDLVAARA